MKNVKAITKEIAKRDVNAKRELNATEISRVLAHLSDILVSDKGHQAQALLLINGKRRKRKATKS